MARAARIWFSIGLLALLATGCRSARVENATLEVRENVVERVVHDSIVLRDSIYVRVAADTVYQTQYRTVYRERISRDTIALHDTVFVEKVVETGGAGAEEEDGGTARWWLLLFFLLVLWRIGVFDLLSGFFKKN